MGDEDLDGDMQGGSWSRDEDAESGGEDLQLQAAPLQAEAAGVPKAAHKPCTLTMQFSTRTPASRAESRNTAWSSESASGVMSKHVA